MPGMSAEEPLFRKKLVAAVKRRAVAPGAAVSGSLYKLEINDDECIDLLLLMTPPEQQVHPHYEALKKSRRLLLGWERATFTATGGALRVAADKEARLKELAEQGKDVVVTVVSVANPEFRLLVQAVDL
jgi:hypothetical protein